MTQDGKKGQKAPHGGIEGVADMLREMSPDEQEKMIRNLSEKDPEMARKIRERVHRFEDLKSLSPNELQDLFSQISRPVLILALRGAKESIRDHLARELPSRMAKMLLEEIDDLGPQPLSTIQEAQKQIGIRVGDLLNARKKAES